MDTEAEIYSVLNECTQSYFQRHGGSVTLEAFRDGVAYVRSRGACAGCPAAESSLKEYVQEQLCQKVPLVTRVEMVQAIDPELLATARRLLNHEIGGQERTADDLGS